MSGQYPMEELIVKYLQNELSKDETSRLIQWLENDPLNRKVFENMVSHWKLDQQEISDVKHRVFTKVTGEPTQTVIRQSYVIRRPIRRLLQLAAVLIMAGTISIITWKIARPVTDQMQSAQAILIEKEALNGQKLSFELSDGTWVKLNSGSKLVYPKAFKEDSRTVQLTGEGFFHVQRDETRPFTVKADMVDVRVLGTAFNVRSYVDESEIAVSVQSGKVGVSSSETNGDLILASNERAIYRTKDRTLHKDMIADNLLVFGWVDKQLTFKDERFEEVLKALTRWFDIEFEVVWTVDEAKRFTGSYENPSLKVVMESLSYAYGFSYEINGKKVIIK